MIWLTWRQFRAQAIVAAAVLAALAVLLAVTGIGLADGYNAAGLNTCHASCSQDASNFLTSLKGSSYVFLFYAGIAVLYAAPALIGLFWGAPLIARELEQGTYRLAWNQSVTRDRWTSIKLAVVGLGSMATAGLLSLMISWWASPIDDALNLGTGSNGPVNFSRVGPVLFAARGIAPVGYAAFAFALGVTIGVLFRRTLPAMALTLALFAAVQVLVPNLVRPDLIAPEKITAPLNGSRAAIEMTQGAGQLH